MQLHPSFPEDIICSYQKLFYITGMIDGNDVYNTILHRMQAMAGAMRNGTKSTYCSFDFSLQEKSQFQAYGGK